MGRHRHAHGRLAAVVMVTALAVGGCTSTADISGATLAPLSSSASQTSAAGSAGSVAESTEVSSAAESTPASSSEVATTSDATVGPSAETPWAGLDLTEGQVADAEAAVTAYRGYRRVSDLTFSNPQKDWAPDVYAFAADPVASNLLNFVKDPAFQKGIGEGHTTINPRVIAAETDYIELSDCVDNSESTFVDSDGNSLIAPDSPGFYRRHPATVKVTHENDRWLVTSLVNDFTVQC